MMNVEKIVNEALKAWEARDLNKTASLLADNFRMTGVTPKPVTKEAFLMFQRVHNEAFPDWKFNVSDMGARGNEVDVTYRIRATHTGVYDVSKLGIALPPVQPTGKTRTWPRETMTFTLKNGKITHVDIEIGAGGGVAGTLEWLGVKIPAGMLM